MYDFCITLTQKTYTAYQKRVEKNQIALVPFYFSTIVFPLYSPHEHILCGCLYSPHTGHFTNVGAANL